MNPVTKQISYGKHTITLETGRVARQATGAVFASMDDTKVLATVVGAKSAKPGQDFFPLSVHYQERVYAAGKIPGGFLKREGRPSEKETLTSRLIDRPIRPLFPNGFMNEVQVVITVLSANSAFDPDILAMVATSAALSISGIPFNGPIGAARVGFTDADGYMLNPTYEELESSRLDMIVAGTEDAVLMVESEADELTEDQMLGGVLYAHQELQAIIGLVKEFAAEAGKPRWEWEAPAANQALIDVITEEYAEKIGEAYRITDKLDRYSQVGVLKDDAVEKFGGEDSEFADADIQKTISGLEKTTVRQRILSGEPRIDGRDNKTVRPIEVEVGMLPNVHGSALFTRGETQAIGAVTLGSTRDAQRVDQLHGEIRDGFMLHYNFPPYSVGECGRMGGVGRREVGHGRLARRGLAAMLPTEDEFPYAIRVVSEITESNGSSSMASVCVGSLSLMDAGVPVKAPVAGIAMGLVKEGNSFAVLTDILGDEDHLGDMDFKVAGSSEGITALQMDIKIEGITAQIMEIALEQAQQARLSILGDMNQVLATARSETASSAPRIHTMKIDSDKIRDVIGKGGATIRGITESTGAQVDIEDDGTIRIYAPNGDSLNAAINEVEGIVAEVEPGTIYKGVITRIADFGAFVRILPGKEGLLHISQIAHERVESVTDYLKEGQEIEVKALEVDNRGRIKLSRKELLPKPERTPSQD
ncbi:Polyribonucleotide nucleotidyltransferase [BD1-7 clade bacterium]|uniref:Polyribonucleotide nucleotidyltransferase n=1 Tax=BD1-7 clade bacterium TaxID=2029982 RepID=A0A5S9MTX0_9GAMM|nr:Polyribonucleotide nucleotidyltransferase [BD1-7 clade bacterium]